MTRTPLPTLQVDLAFLTPAFLAGADQDGAPELRIPSLRGALRHWLRAIDPAWPDRERVLFGDTRRQGAALIRLVPMSATPPPWSWSEHARTIDRVFMVGRGKEAKNGVKYLGYTLSLRGNEGRQAWPAGTAFSLRISLPDRTALLPPDRREDPRATAGLVLSDQDVRALLGATWALGCLGALGTRARRGFGSLELRGWSWHGGVPATWRADLDSLLLVNAQVPTLDEALRRLEQGRATLREWLGQPTGKVPHLGAQGRVVLLPAARVPGLPRDLEWATPLQVAGLAMQTFRSAREPDRSEAREHVRHLAGRGGTALRRSPERVVFGLPLTFRFLANPRREMPAGQFEVNPALTEPHTGKASQRFPSPLRIKAIQTRQGKAALLVRMDGCLPGDDMTVVRGAKDRLPAPGANLLDTFMNELSPSSRRR